ncbi:MAG TPA: DUF3352 domain-containing protein [Gaiellaceae bacterium]|nr:DUF3352 domain-containing protein [Gaiellaceae bacterium]
MRRRFLPALLLVLFGLVVAACGSKATTGSAGGSTPEGAELVRAGIVAFVTVDSDTGSSQWQQLDELAQKFPGRDRALEQIEEAFTKEGVDWESDVQPALGPELDIAVAAAGVSPPSHAVALTKPDDPTKLKALVTKLNTSDRSSGSAVYREIDGWYAVSDSQAAITDVLKGDRPALSGDDAFKQALDKLPGEALVKAYVDGQRVDELFTEAASARGGGFDAPSLGLDTLKYIAAAVSAEESGLRIRGASSGGPGGGGDFASKLLGGVPGDALALLDFQGSGTTDQLGRLKSNPQIAAAIAQVEKQLGVTLDELIALFSGENAFYVRSGIGIPEFTLVLGGHDQGAALATLDKLAANLAAATGGKIEAGSQGGHPVKTVDLGQFAIHYGGVDGKVILTSGVSGIADYGSSDSLSDSADFKEARSAAGMPDSTGAFTYLDIKNALPLLEGLASLSGENLPSEVTENLRPLRSFLAWSQGPASSRTFDVFLEIE